MESSTILDVLGRAATAIRGLPTEEAEVVATSWWGTFSTEERVAFDLFLVKMGDELAFSYGTPFSRFFERVRRMAHLAETGEVLN